MDFTEAYRDTCSTAAHAASVGDVDTLRNLIKQGKPVDVKDNRGWISLHEAAHNGHVECLKLVLNQDAELVDFRTFQEETALMLACRSASLPCIKHLIESRADVNASTFEGFSPLWEAAVSKSLECVRTLLQAGANINGQIFTGDTALHHAVQHGQTAIVTCLLESGADITVKTENHITPLFLAAQFGQLECFNLLIESARKIGSTFLIDYINTPAYDKATPLYLAAQEGHTDCVDLLLQLGADPHVYVQMDQNPGHYLYPLQAAISKNNLGCVQLLLKATDMERFDWTIFKSKKRPIANLERPPSAFVQPLYLSMDHENADCLKLLISHGYMKQYQKAVEEQSIGNIFQMVPLRIKPVVTFVKCCERWLHRQYQSKNWGLYSTALFETPHEVTLQLLVILLRTGAPSGELLQRTSLVTRNAIERLVLLCKYLTSERFCSECTRMKRPACIENLLVLGPRDFEKIDITLLLKLFLTPNFMRVAARLDPLLPKKSDRDLLAGQARAEAGEGDEEPAEKPALVKMRQTLVHCRKSFNTLQHMCRMNVIYQLLHANNYTREATLTLVLPTHLQSYLLYDDTGSFGDILVEAAAGIRDVETAVDKLFEETDVSDIRVPDVVIND